MDATLFNIGICEMSADLFVQSVKNGYDSKDFIEKLMCSDTATYLYDKTYTQMWIGSNYIIQTLEQEVTIERGKQYTEDLMAWTGYLFACWNLRNKNGGRRSPWMRTPFSKLQKPMINLQKFSYILQV